MMATLKKSELRPVISAMEPWQRISLLAGSLTRIAAVFTVFADDDEKNVYFTAVEDLWSSVEGQTRLNVEQVYSRFLLIWPYGDEDEADDDDDDSFDLYTPVYWKLQALKRPTLSSGGGPARKPPREAGYLISTEFGGHGV